MVGFRKLSLIFSGLSDAGAMVWAGGRETFILVYGAPPIVVDQ